MTGAGPRGSRGCWPEDASKRPSLARRLTSAITTHLVHILVSEFLGYRVRVLHRRDPKYGLQRVAAGITTIHAEI